MVLPSDQASRMISAQQQAYALQAAHAARAGQFPSQFYRNPELAGFTPANFGLQQDPLTIAGFGGTAQPSLMAAGVGGALPGAVAMGTMAAGVFGYRNRLGWLDPYTGVSRSFGAGASRAAGLGAQGRAIIAGAEGMGLKAGFQTVGSAFAQGGLRAGAGVLAGGLMGAATGALPYYLTGKGIDAVAGNIQEGARNIEDVRGMIQQSFSPQLGQSGARIGGGPSRQMVKNVTSFLHEMASEDVLTSMKDMKQLMDQAGQTGMLSGVFDERTFKERFRNIVRQARGVSEILGVTLKEGGQFLSQAQRMGLWTAQDVMGAAVSAKAMGPGSATAMMGAMQQGAQMSHALGGTLRTGAQFGRQLFEQTTAAQQAGVLSERDIMEFTGGVGGAEGRQMIAGQMQRLGATYSRSPMGTLMMAGLGEIKGEGQAQEFTGRVDPELLRQFQTGAVTVQELAARGRKRVGQNRNLATSFHMAKAGLSQEVVGQMGMEGMAASMQAVIDKAGYGNAPEAIQRRFMQLQTPGMSDRDAQMMQKIMRDLPRIQEERSRRQNAALEDSLRQLQDRRYRSFEGLSDALGSMWEEGIERPIQEATEGFVTRMGEQMDSMVRSITGRTRQIARLDPEARRRLMGGAGGVFERLQRGTPMSYEDLGITGIGQGALDTSIVQRNIMSMQMGQARGTQEFAGAGTMSALETMKLSPVARVLARQGAQMRRIQSQEELKPGEVYAGGGFGGAGFAIRAEEQERVTRQGALRALSPTMQSLFGGENEKQRDAMETVKSSMREMYSDIEVTDRLRRVKEEKPDSYAKTFLEELKKRPGANQALSTLGKGERDIQTDLNAVAVATNELDVKGGALAIEFNKDAPAVPSGPPEEVERWFEDKIKTAAKSTVTYGWLHGQVSEALRDVGMGRAAAKDLAKAMVPFSTSQALTEADIRKLTTSGKFGVADIAAFAAQGEGVPKELRDLAKGGEASKFTMAAERGDEVATKTRELLQDMSAKQSTTLLQQLSEIGTARGGILQKETVDRLQEIAKGRGPILRLSGVRQETTNQLEEIRQAFAGRDTAAAFGQMSRLTESLSRGKGRRVERDIDRLLMGAGGMGGVHAGRMAAIERAMQDDTVTSKEYGRLQQRLRRSGVDIDRLMSEEQKSALVKMMQSGKGLEGSEIQEVTKVLKDIAKRSFDTGPGAGGVEQKMRAAQIEYLDKNRAFVDAVGRALGDKLVTAASEDVKDSGDKASREAAG